jgi:uncharacterized repeat protein (TIGR01451 family)
MNKGSVSTVVVSLLGLAGSLAVAQNPPPQAGCIELKSVAEIEESFRDEQGREALRRVPVSKVVPGTQVIWTLSATNVCAAPADKVFIDNPVPEHMQLVADSVRGNGAEISYSLDGKRFAAPEQLKVVDADGQPRAARSDEYKHIRWSFRNSIGPGQLAAATFRATVR